MRKCTNPALFFLKMVGFTQLRERFVILFLIQVLFSKPHRLPSLRYGEISEVLVVLSFKGLV